MVQKSRGRRAKPLPAYIQNKKDWNRVAVLTIRKTSNLPAYIQNKKDWNDLHFVIGEYGKAAYRPISRIRRIETQRWPSFHHTLHYLPAYIQNKKDWNTAL